MVQGSDGVVELEDEPIAVEAMLSFCYDMDYTKEQPKHAERDVMFHVQVYKLAQKYEIEDLKTGIYPRLRKAMKAPGVWEDDRFVDAVMQLYGISSVGVPHSLQDLVEDACVDQSKDLVHKECFLKALEVHPALNRKILVYLAGYVEKCGVDTAKANSGPVEFFCGKCEAAILQSYWLKHKYTKNSNRKTLWWVDCPSCNLPVDASRRLTTKRMAYF